MLFFVILLLIHSMVGLNTEDDNIFRDLYKEYDSLGSFLVDRYQGWSSRIVIEAVLIPILGLSDWIWRVLDSIIIIIGIFAMAEIVFPEGKKKYTAILCLIPFTVSKYAVSSAGYGATTLNYVWPLGLGLFCAIPLAKSIKKESCNPMIKAIGLIFAVYACDQEQMAAILLGVSLFCIVYSKIRKEKQQTYIWILAILACLMLLFEVTCPGNKLRSEAELHYFNEFREYRLIDKLQIGYLNTLAYYFGIVQSNISILLLLVASMVSLVRQRKWKILPVLLPAVFLFTYYRCVVEGILIKEKETKTITLFQNFYPSRYVLYSKMAIAIECIAYFVVVTMLVVGIHKLHTHSQRAWICNLILLAGFLSRFILGFSASIVLSGYRTTIFCTVAMNIVACILIEPLLPGKKTCIE